jgi:hypothetical protein
MFILVELKICGGKPLVDQALDFDCKSEEDLYDHILGSYESFEEFIRSMVYISMTNIFAFLEDLAN